MSAEDPQAPIVIYATLPDPKRRDWWPVAGWAFFIFWMAATVVLLHFGAPFDHAIP